jgi:hypothetical protein
MPARHTDLRGRPGPRGGHPTRNGVRRRAICTGRARRQPRRWRLVGRGHRLLEHRKCGGRGFEWRRGRCGRWPSEPDGDCALRGREDLTCAEMFAGQAEGCLDACLPITPNGCDCFGCCELDGVFVWLGSLDETNLFGECDLSDVGQPHFLEHCHPCTPVPACHNACDPCELCVGKGALPPECGSEQICPPGAPACGLAGQPLCPSGTYCITGCCQPLPP